MQWRQPLPRRQPAGNLAGARSSVVARWWQDVLTGFAHVVSAPALGEAEAAARVALVGEGWLAEPRACQTPPNARVLGSARVHTDGDSRRTHPTPHRNVG